MNLGSSIIVLAVALTLSAAAQAGDDGTSTSGAQKPVKQRLICKQEAELGTRMAKRVCKTWETWKKEEAATSAMAKNFLDKASEQASASGAMAAGAGPGGQ